MKYSAIQKKTNKKKGVRKEKGERNGGVNAGCKDCEVGRWVDGTNGEGGYRRGQISKKCKWLDTTCHRMIRECILYTDGA